MITRRQLGLGSLAAAGIPWSARAQAKRRVTFTLPWLAEGSTVFIYVAKGMGYWDELGLDVQISRGYGSVAAAQAVGAGQFQFGAAAANAAIQQATKGLPVVALGCCGYDATMGVAVLDDSPIRKPSDLAGRKVGSTVTSAEYPFFPAYAERAGFDFKSIELVKVEAAVRQRVLVERQVDAITGLAISTVPPFVAQHIAGRSLLYSAVGLKLYNNVLMTQLATLRDEPKLCADMTIGLLKAVKYTMLNPEAAIEVFARLVPESRLAATVLDQVKVGVGIFNVSNLQDPALTHGAGFMVPEDYQSMTDLVMQYVAGPGDVKPKQSDLYTNQFVGPVTFTPEEWKTAQAKAKPYEQYLV